MDASPLPPNLPPEGGLRPRAPLPLVTEPADMSRNCLFGCGALVLAFAVIIGVGAFMMYFMARRMVEQYTAAEPQPLPAVAIDGARLAALQRALADFAAAIDTGAGPRTLTLTAGDINLLLAGDPAFEAPGKWLHVRIEAGRIGGEISFPLAALEVKAFDLANRYINGTVELDVRLEGGRLGVYIAALEVNGAAAPEELMNGLRVQNLAEDMTADAEAQRYLDGIERVEVRDDQVVITRKESGHGDQSADDDRGFAA